MSRLARSHRSWPHPGLPTQVLPGPSGWRIPCGKGAGAAAPRDAALIPRARLPGADPLPRAGTHTTACPPSTGCPAPCSSRSCWETQFPSWNALMGGVAELGVRNPGSQVGASRASRGGAEQAQPRSCHPGKELGWSWRRWASLGATECLSCVGFVPLGQRLCLGCSAIATQWLCRGWHSGCHL